MGCEADKKTRNPRQVNAPMPNPFTPYAGFRAKLAVAWPPHTKTMTTATTRMC